MKLSVSLPEADVRFLDDYGRTAHLDSRSAAVQTAVKQLRESLLAHEYEELFSDPDYLLEASVWDVTSADGLSDEAW